MCTKIDTVPDVGHGLLIASGESLADKIGAVAFHACSALKNIGCDAIMESVARMALGKRYKKTLFGSFKQPAPVGKVKHGASKLEDAT